MLATVSGTALWALISVALQVSSEPAPSGTGHKMEVHVLGFTNAYDTPFAVLWVLILVLVWLAAQPSMQITLILTATTLLAHLELIDAARKARAL